MIILKRFLVALGVLAVLLVLAVVALVMFAPGLHISSLEMVLNVMTGRGADVPEGRLMSRLQPTEGYQLSIYARDLPNPRMLETDDAGRLLVSNPRVGEILLLEDTDGDGAADTRSALLTGLTRPHGLALHGGYLYVAESDKVGRAPYTAGKLTGSYEIIADGFTDNGNHWTKSIEFGPDGYLYLAMGSTCNVCVEEDERRATIMQFDADGSDGRVYASGLRNSVGMDFAPWSGELYATDNGRDLLGDDYPPCELNRIVEGGFYGWPFLNADNEKDPDFGKQRPDLQANAIIPVHHFPAHNAPLGIHFTGRDRSALVALHGSWNRSEPDGYKVVRLHFGEDGQIDSEDFLDGFERNGDIIGRPVDIAGDGAEGFFVSDDYAGVIYRVSPRAGLASAGAITTGAADQAALDPALVAAGERLYRQLPCASCHGETAVTPVPLQNLANKYTADSLAEYFQAPTPPMPRYPLDREQRAQLAHYLLKSRG